LSSANKTIKGIAASPGVVKGQVAVLRSFGERRSNSAPPVVLVVRFLTPDVVPAMLDSLAIISDEGGFTCHAACIARELGIPCVSGTHVATQELREGDIVEVDGDAGLVTLL